MLKDGKMKTSLFLPLLFIVTSCHMLAPTGLPSISYKIIPGECLLSTDMTYIPLEDPVRDSCLIFCFSLDLDEGVYERVSRRLPKTYRLIPPQRYFDALQYGRNVKAEFSKIYDSFTELYEESFSLTKGYEIMTILYDGGISLKADKEFAGCPTGENLAHLITGVLYDGVGVDPVISHINNTSEKAGSFLGITMNYISMTETNISYKIPMNGMNLSDESVIFTLDIPVKVVKYLNWIDSKVNDLNADFPYEDVVLHCKFRTGFGLAI